MVAQRSSTSFRSILVMLLCSILPACSKPAKDIFAMENLVAWCIVPFDAKQRSPSERAELLQNLGFQKFAYDWREKHIPEFDEEVARIREKGIEMIAFWWSGGLPKSEEDLNSSELMKMQLDFFKRNSLKLDVWMTLSDADLKNESDAVKYEQLSKRIDILAAELRKIDCRLGLYNHGGWGGEPENLMAVMKKVKSPNVGIVYNFHHGHEHLDKIHSAFPVMLPYLYCVNLNGMNRKGPKILPIGQGEEDARIIRMIIESGYDGPIGILGHIEDEDVEIVLRRNLEGLKGLISDLDRTSL